MGHFSFSLIGFIRGPYIQEYFSRGLLRAILGANQPAEEVLHPHAPLPLRGGHVLLVPGGCADTGRGDPAGPGDLGGFLGRIRGPLKGNPSLLNRHLIIISRTFPLILSLRLLRCTSLPWSSSTSWVGPKPRCGSWQSGSRKGCLGGASGVAPPAAASWPSSLASSGMLSSRVCNL